MKIQKMEWGTTSMTEFKIKNATVRIHGNSNPDKLKAATVNFMKKAQKQKRRMKQNEREISQGKMVHQA